MHVTVGEYKGDSLANSNKGDRTSKHNRVLRAAQNAIRARSVGSIVLGDKEKPEVTRHLNDTSVTDICELGGDFATMRDVHYEVKCWNPLTSSRRRRCTRVVGEHEVRAAVAGTAASSVASTARRPRARSVPSPSAPPPPKHS